jgi:hypothetical protein
MRSFLPVLNVLCTPSVVFGMCWAVTTDAMLNFLCRAVVVSSLQITVILTLTYSLWMIWIKKYSASLWAKSNSKYVYVRWESTPRTSLNYFILLNHPRQIAEWPLKICRPYFHVLHASSFSFGTACEIRHSHISDYEYSRLLDTPRCSLVDVPTVERNMLPSFPALKIMWRMCPLLGNDSVNTFLQQRIRRQQSDNFRCYATDCKYNSGGRVVFYFGSLISIAGRRMCFLWVRLETI